MAVVQVMGGSDGARDGLRETVAKFRKHNAEEGDQLLNISGIGTVNGVPVDKDDPRPQYRHMAFPKMVYHAEKRAAVGACEAGEAIVHTVQEYEALKERGYRDEPYPAVRVAIEDPKVEKAALEMKLKQKDGEIANLNDVLVKALSRLDALENKRNK